MPNAKISKRTVDGIDTTRGKSGSVQLWDTEIRGFGVRAYRSGRKVYVLKSTIEGKQRFLTLGEHGRQHTADTARVAARELCFRRSQGGEAAPARRQKQPASSTISELIDLYLREGPASRPNKRPSSWATDSSRLNRHVRRLLGAKPGSAITMADVEAMQKDIAEGRTAIVEKTKARGKAIVEGGRIAASNSVVCLSAMFSWAVRRNLVERNPCMGVQKFARPKRIRCFSTTETKSLLDALDQLQAQQSVNPLHADAIRVLMLTGARKMEILALKWTEVALDRKLIILPDARSKNHDWRYIYLPKPAVEILHRLPRESEFVFPCRRSSSGHIVGVPETWERVTKSAGIANARLHDLRHNLASTAVGLNISLPLTGALLGHKSMQSTQIYAHIAVDPAQQASEQVAEVIWASRVGTTTRASKDSTTQSTRRSPQIGRLPSCVQLPDDPE